MRTIRHYRLDFQDTWFLKRKKLADRLSKRDYQQMSIQAPTSQNLRMKNNAPAPDARKRVSRQSEWVIDQIEGRKFKLRFFDHEQKKAQRSKKANEEAIAQQDRINHMLILKEMIKRDNLKVKMEQSCIQQVVIASDAMQICLLNRITNRQYRNFPA